MWKKLLVVIVLFYFFALLQSSFFTHFDLFGTTPNLVFILFFIIVFFEKNNLSGHTGNNYQIVLFAVIAGIFLDIFSYTYIGPSIIILMAIGFLLKIIQSLLMNRGETYPFIYFLPLFIIFLLAYDLLLGFYLYFVDPNKINMIFGTQTIFFVIYNSFIASAFFFAYKWPKFIR